MKKETWYQNEMRKSPRRTVEVDEVDEVDETNIEIEVSFRPIILIVIILIMFIIIFL